MSKKPKSLRRQVVEQYFSYIEGDQTLQQGAFNKAIAEGATLFLEIGSLYRDSSLAEYIMGRRPMETTANQSYSPTPDAAIGQESRQVVSRKKPPRTHTAKKVWVEVVQEKELLAEPGFNSLEGVMKRLGIDRKILTRILEETHFCIEQRTYGGRQLEGISDSTYEQVRKYVRRTRS